MNPAALPEPPAVPGEVCADLDRSGALEWLETNGLGGFASGTVAGPNTGRYHGLLTAARNPPVQRCLLLAKLEEVLLSEGGEYELSANHYPGTVHPQGYRFLKSFRLDPWPVWEYRVETAGGAALRLERSVTMIHGEDTVVIRWRLLDAPAGAGAVLRVRPLVAFRDYHALTCENAEADPTVVEGEGRVTVRPYPALPALHLIQRAEGLDREWFWYRNVEYPVERERGFDFREDLLSPCAFRFDLAPGRDAYLAASAAERVPEELPALLERERTRRAAIAQAAPVPSTAVRRLCLAADQFIVRRGEGHTVIAGYPWFTDWGRDTMVALPGLALVTGRHDVARGILAGFVRHMDRGLIPNRFPDRGEEPEYNTVDGTLWMFAAVGALLRHTGDYEFVRRELYPALADSIEWHLRGTRHGIGADADGLLRAGEEGVQLTWMDARIGDWVVTPRRGKPVEVQGLWHRALREMEHLAARFGHAGDARRYGRLAARAARSFGAQFWYEKGGYFYDVVSDQGPDPSLRPNQAIALAVAPGIASQARTRKALAVVRDRLLTPVGLRTLSPDDERYRPRYEGDVWSRDSAYHQGTVWPWLLGPFITAWVRAHRGSAGSRADARGWLAGLQTHLHEAGLGQLSEVFDGDPPHRPGGCPAQAWSVAEVLRALVEDVEGIRTDLREGAE